MDEKEKGKSEEQPEMEHVHHHDGHERMHHEHPQHEHMTQEHEGMQHEGHTRVEPIGDEKHAHETTGSSMHMERKNHGSMEMPAGQEHEGHVDHTGHEEMFRRKFWISLFLSIPVLLYSHGLQNLLAFQTPVFTGSSWISPAFSLIVFIYGGVPFIRMAIPEIKNRKPGMMTLISLAISVAFVYSAATLLLPQTMDFFWELATLIDIMLLGHWIEMRSIRQASGALDALAKLMPDMAERVNADGSTTQISSGDLAIGDVVLVRPGASIPADGEIIDGSSSINESMITGESKPVSKTVGGKVIGGSINGSGSLRVNVTATGDESALAGIMRLVKQAQESKSNTQILADKAAGWLFYIALITAGITAVAWIIAIGFNVQVIERVATVLVIACPHALGLAIPLVVSITTGMGASNGILIRDRLSMEKARLINTVVFDKTGTLTEGRFGVVGIATDRSLDENEALALAGAIEGDSEHTIAQGIVRSAKERNLTIPEVRDFKAIAGRGVQAEYGEEIVYVGGPRLLEQLSLQLPGKLADFAEQANAKGQSVVHLARGMSVVASLALADVIRPESKTAVQSLHNMGIQVAMLTGDSRAVAKAVADELGIDEFFAEVLPENKDQKIIELQKQGRSVAMVGDGVNDAPALTRADVGIAIGSGTDVAVESAGIILVKNNPLDVVKILRLSKASYRKMNQNLIWATGYNVVALPLAAGVLAPWGILLSPAVGAILMSLSTIIVAINAQLLRLQKLDV